MNFQPSITNTNCALSHSYSETRLPPLSQHQFLHFSPSDTFTYLNCFSKTMYCDIKCTGCCCTWGSIPQDWD